MRDSVLQMSNKQFSISLAFIMSDKIELAKKLVGDNFCKYMVTFRTKP